MISASNKKNSVIAQIIKTKPELVTFLKEDDLVDATLLRKEPRAAYFDLGKFGTGIVYGTELLNARSILKTLEEGQQINAKVVSTENDDGYIELSLAGAHKQKNWQELKDIKESGTALEVTIIGANSGGLVAEVNDIKAFLPVSQLATEHYPRVADADKNKILEELKKLVNETLTVKIIDVNPRLNKLILSEKEATEQNVKDLLAQYTVGSEIEGIVSGVADFGAFVRFVDNPSIEGLIHISELDHRLVDNPKEVVSVDQTVRVKIIDIKDNQVFLSLKALTPNPWDTAGDVFKEGQEVKGTVYKFNPFGAYISLPHNLQGLIHVSEFGSIDEMKQHLEAGTSYSFSIESVKPEEKRIVLKLKK